MDAKATRVLNFTMVLTRVEPTWEVSWFFVLHGVCTALEVLVKKSEFGEKWRLNRLVSGVLTIGAILIIFIKSYPRNVPKFSIFVTYVKKYGVFVEIRDGQLRASSSARYASEYAAKLE
ncbi:hypothetical protein Syun_001526 [Stephania yunnanensis]|uniref:Uncharacterized protein n=1 Tax=Stephania yunnanensis TaxID=152371 RepID=A0AAP0LE32_9MAGN